jgi:Haem-binding uptake, Tiki superfamily, ChaN
MQNWMQASALVLAVARLVAAAPAAGPAVGQNVSARPAVPVEPVAAILDAFRSYNVVALDEGNHGNEQGHALRLALIRHPRFAEAVNDIVVEFGNSRYQDVMDRFTRGEEVPHAQLRDVWQNTTQNWTWDSPIYEELFRAVRTRNAKLPRDRQIRVLLGDPPIDWDEVRTPSDHFAWLEQRDRVTAAIVNREVLAKGRKALLIFGALHLQRRHISANYEELEQADTIVTRIARNDQAKVFSIATHMSGELDALQPGASKWPVPSMALVRGTILGATDFARYFPSEMPRFAIRDGKPTPLPRDLWRMLPMEEQFDAVLYLGPPSSITLARLSPKLCADQSYLAMRAERLKAIGQQDQIKNLHRACGMAGPR